MATEGFHLELKIHVALLAHCRGRKELDCHLISICKQKRISKLTCPHADSIPLPSSTNNAIESLPYFSSNH